ncbi:MAG: alpha/beta hydrolase [Proteobacteria bacterium]|nr:alpha/beta hydrolase [Pseudomonadota bacterium]
MTTILAHFYAKKLIFPYQQSSYSANISGLLFVKATDGTKIATRFWKASDEKALILYFHGNYMDIGHLDEIAIKLNHHNYSVLAMDYRGYGLSEGKVNESNSYSDAQSVYAYAIKQGYKSENIIILGRSIGAGIATELAVNNSVKALVLISPFTSTYRVMTTYPIFLFDKFNNLSKINKIDTPLFIVHGANDQVIPAWHSEKLVSKHQGKNKRILVQGAGHNDIWEVGDSRFLVQFEKFITQ